MTYWKFFKANLLKLFAFLAALCGMAFIMYRGDDHAAAKWVYLVCGFIAVVSAFALLVQWNTRHRGHTDDHPNGHYSNICEGCPRAQYKDGSGPVSFDEWLYWNQVNGRVIPSDNIGQAAAYGFYTKHFNR